MPNPTRRRWASNEGWRCGIHSVQPHDVVGVRALRCDDIASDIGAMAKIKSFLQAMVAWLAGSLEVYCRRSVAFTINLIFCAGRFTSAVSNWAGTPKLSAVDAPSLSGYRWPRSQALLSWKNAGVLKPSASVRGTARVLMPVALVAATCGLWAHALPRPPTAAATGWSAISRKCWRIGRHAPSRSPTIAATA